MGKRGHESLRIVKLGVHNPDDGGLFSFRSVIMTRGTGKLNAGADLKPVAQRWMRAT